MLNPSSLAIQGVIYLSAMVLTVPLAKRLGVGAVLGYLIAGSVLGPYCVGLLSSSSDALHLAEFGIIMMLFLIGLELRPQLLWRMRGPILGLGAFQVGLTAAAFSSMALLFDQTWQSGLAIGLILSLSSTAIVLRTLEERRLLKTPGGEAAFSVLLFQDMAVIPMLAIFPLLSANPLAAKMEATSTLLQTAKILAAVGLVIALGKFLIRPLFKMVAQSHLRELFTALALLLVLSITILMNAVELSPALGAFLAGVVLADSEYRHQLESDIQPFKGLLLGVFFISIGVGIIFELIFQRPFLIVLFVLCGIVLKALLLLGVGLFGKIYKPDRYLFALSLAQGGEFAFVLTLFASELNIFSTEISQLLTAGVTLSMATTPLLVQAYTRWIQPRFMSQLPERKPDAIDERDNPIIVAGIGRFGQMASRLLRASGYRVTILDHDAEQVELLRKFGTKSFYGDATRQDLLEAAGIRNAKLLILAIDDPEATLQIVDLAHAHYPHLKILARAFDRIHAYQLIHKGVQHVYIETAGSAADLGQDALKLLGVPEERAEKMTALFKQNNAQSIRDLAKVYHEADEATFVTQVKSWLDALEEVLKKDSQENLNLDK